MKRLVSGLLSIIILLLTSCFSMTNTVRSDYFQSGIKQTFDDFENTKYIHLTIAAHDLSLLMERSIRFTKTINRGNEGYSIKTHLYAASWFFLETIKFNIDGTIFEYKSSDNSRDVLNGGYVEELNYFAIDSDLLNALNIGNNITIRLYGKNSYMDIKLGENEKNLFKEYFTQVSHP